MKTTAPYVWLGPRWYAWLEFGPDGRHDAFTAIARRSSDEFGGSISKVGPNSQDDGKEYAEVQVGAARLLLMRKPGLGIGLGASDYPDVPLLLRPVAALYRAECRGWRWPVYQLWQRLSGRAGAALNPMTNTPKTMRLSEPGHRALVAICRHPPLTVTVSPCSSRSDVETTSVI